MSDSGAPLGPALTALAESAAGPTRTILSGLGGSLGQGAGLGDAMASVGSFSPAEVELVRVGERMGRLGDSLRDLAALADRRVEARRQLRKHLAYPAVVVASWCALDPVTTLIAGGLSDYLIAVATRLAILVAAWAALAWGAPALGRRGPARRRLGGLLWRGPWPASVPRARARARLARVLGQAIASGLGADEALLAAGRAADAPGSVERTRGAAQALAVGASLTEALVAHDLLDPAGRLVLTAAEHAGTLDEALASLAERYADLADRGEQTLVRVMGAALTLAVLVGVALSILGAWGDATSGTDDILRQLDREVPFDLHGTGLERLNPRDLRDLRDLLPRGR